MAKRLENAGASAIMPLAAPIGSGLGILNKVNIRKKSYYVKTKNYVETLTSPLRVGMGETNIAADIPESVPAWIEFQEKHKSEKK